MRRFFPLPFIGAVAILLVIPGIREYATASKWSFLAVAVAISVCFTKIRYVPGSILGFWLINWALLSLLWCPVIDDGLQGMAWLLIMAGAFILGAVARDLRLLFIAMGFTLVPSMLNMALARFTGIYWAFGGVFPLGGTFGNPNFAGEVAAAVAASALGANWQRRSILPVIAVGPALATMLLSGCRGAIVGFGAVALVRLWQRSRVGVVILVLLGVFWLGATLSQPAHREAIAQRFLIYHDTIDGLTFLGRGIGQYRAVMPEKGHRLSALNLNTEHAHNDLLEVAFELGVPGVVLFAWLCATALRAARSEPSAAYAMGSLLVAGLFGFPLFEPVASFLFAVLAGHLCAAGARLRNDMDERAGHPGAGVQGLAATSTDAKTASGGESVPAGLEIAESCGRHGGDARPMVAAGTGVA